MGHSNLPYARAMHERLSLVADAFRAGDIDFGVFRALVFRTDLVTDDAQCRTARILAERTLNQSIREQRSRTLEQWLTGIQPAGPGEEPPPF